ncbi:MAG: hypothetical protein J4N66_04525 [Chloroflexi bacterium]|nr:hypothetical protein [Chloroflexota bacterium]
MTTTNGGAPTGEARYPLSSPREGMSKLSEQLDAFLRLKLGESVSIAGGLKRLQGGSDTDTFAFDGIDTIVENFPLSCAHRWASVSPERGN